jgi:hypothetical protein
MEVEVLEHPHVLATRPTRRWDSRDLKSIYVVETDLALSRNDPGFDLDAVQDLFVAARDYLDANPGYDGLKIVPYRR